MILVMGVDVSEKDPFMTRIVGLGIRRATPPPSGVVRRTHFV